MRRYFFDIADGGASRDDTGTEYANDAEACRAALRVLPDVARDEVPQDGHQRLFTLVVRNDKGEAIYTATLSFSALWLGSRPKAS